MKTKRWTVVFLLDQLPPNQIVLLKRAENKKFAPGWYTGIGGKQEEGETIEQTAYRELKEEVGIGDIKLHEFARVIVNGNEKALHYFWGIYSGKQLPACTEGTLEFLSPSKVLTKQIIPTTKYMIKEWKKREFATDQQWTMFIKRDEDENGFASDISIERITDGLH